METLLTVTYEVLGLCKLFALVITYTSSYRGRSHNLACRIHPPSHVVLLEHQEVIAFRTLQ